MYLLNQLIVYFYVMSLPICFVVNTYIYTSLSRRYLAAFEAEGGPEVRLGAALGACLVYAIMLCFNMLLRFFLLLQYLYY